MLSNSNNILSNYIKLLIKDNPVKNFKFESNTSYYDNLTHFYLGEYLRYLRDNKDLDLMPFYNLYCGNLISNLKLTYSANIQNNKLQDYIKVEETDKTNNVLDIMAIMIKPNINYSIYLDSDIPIYLVTVAYDKNKLLKVTPQNSLCKRRCVYNEPFIYKFDLDENDSTGDRQLLEDYAILLIQVPRYSKNRLVIEGEYPLSYIDDFKSNDQYPIVLSNEINSFLLKYNITNNDNIKENITNIQDKLTQFHIKNLPYKFTLDEISDNLKTLFLGIDKLSLGYINRNVEDFIRKGSR